MAQNDFFLSVRTISKRITVLRLCMVGFLLIVLITIYFKEDVI